MLQWLKRKTPISYYGGKQQMASKIAKAIPAHQLYCEPFFGGGAVYFAKEPSEIEVIGDKNEVVANFYQVAQDEDLFPLLQKLVVATPYARREWAEARNVWRNADCFSDLKKAWAFRVLSAMCFSSSIGS
ncbi:DNA adenine methylase [Flexibacter flexilis DSM 6793]|nr:DNA adenine methylase [Flexibacter flexilis DSM 6793]